MAVAAPPSTPETVELSHLDQVGANPWYIMRIIGITGAARHGKDSIAQAILKHAPGSQRQGFADKLKLSAARIFHPSIDQETAIEFCEWLKHDGQVAAGDPSLGEEFTQISGRTFLQRYGTEAHRGVFGDDFWLDAVLWEGRNDCGLLVIPDVRFINEAERVKERGGEIWHVHRPDFESDLQGLETKHASEAAIPEQLIDYHIENDAGLEELEQKVIALLSHRERTS